MKFIETQNAPVAIGPYSQAVTGNGVVYTSGQIALNTNGENEVYYEYINNLGFKGEKLLQM